VIEQCADLVHRRFEHAGDAFHRNLSGRVAAAGGMVVVSEVHPAYGNMIEIDHGNGLLSRYAHTSQIFVKEGDLVMRGQRVATVGSTGRSTGPHLHFSVQRNTGMELRSIPFAMTGVDPYDSRGK